jgi:hypothetical protein
MQVIQIPTISHEDRAETNDSKVLELQETLRKLFPKVHHYLDLKIINKYSSLFKWEGQGMLRGVAEY